MFKTNKDKIIYLCCLFIFFIGGIVSIFIFYKNDKPIVHNAFSGYNFNQIETQNNNVSYSYYKMADSKMQDLGVYGDGCQWQTSLESSNDGNLMLYGTDVAGMYRSTDHGKTWEMCNTGINSRGVNMFAIDPFNNNHILLLGCNSSANAQNGIYISYNGGNSFKKILTLQICCQRYLWDGFEFDPTSYDSSKGICTDVYFSSPYYRDCSRRINPLTAPNNESKLSIDEVGLYKSTDGGESFSIINNTLSDGIVKFTNNGNLYIGNQNALYLVDKMTGNILSTYFENTETNQTLKMNKGITGLDIVNNTIYAQLWKGIYKFVDGSDIETINNSMINSTSYPKDLWCQYIEVSQKNQNHIIIEYREDITGSGWKNISMVSFDGGITYENINVDKNSLFSTKNYNGREKLSIIDPSDDNNVITFATDTLLKSEDGGKNFKQVSGISNMMLGGKFNLNYYDTDLLMFSAQDYGGALSIDGGNSWKKLDIIIDSVIYNSMYGGFACDDDTIFGFAGVSFPDVSLVVSHDGGNTWIDTKLTDNQDKKYFYSSMQSYKNPNILFCGKYYSKDRGFTWQEMTNCSSVLTINYLGENEIYGTNSNGNLVVSYDDGESFTTIYNDKWINNSTYERILDCSLDFRTNNLYAIIYYNFKVGEDDKGGMGTKLFKINLLNKSINEIKLNNNEEWNVYTTIAIDPNNTNVIYVGGCGNYFLSKRSFLRSIDGGNTFSVLTSSSLTSIANNQGGYEVSCIRVKPNSGEVIIGTGCFGFEKIDPPYLKDLIKNNGPQSHTLIFKYGDLTINTLIIKNNEKFNYIFDDDGITFVSWFKDKDFKEEFKNGSYVYDNMILYAKMIKSEKINCYVGEKIIKSVDIDDLQTIYKNLPNIDIQNLTFAGWYLDKSLTNQVDFKDLKTTTNIYAGFYKNATDVFNIDSLDMSVYIRQADHKLPFISFVNNSENVDNRSVYLETDKNVSYLITFKMNNRFRIAMAKDEFVSYSKVPFYYQDEDDNNSYDSTNKMVYKTINMQDYNRLIVYYYTINSYSNDFMEIKNTFKIYKLQDSTLYSN